MRTCARAIVLKDDHLLVMERFKLGKHYFTLPGGKVEKGETPDQAAMREVHEETTLHIKDPQLVFVEDAGMPFGDQHIFLCEYVSGEPSLPPDSEEAFWSTPGKNTYEPLWLSLTKLKDVNFVSPLLHEALIMALAHGFPKKPYHFSAKHSARLS